MDIAREEKLPFMIHSRDAAKDTLDIVKEYMHEVCTAESSIVFPTERKWLSST